MARNIESPGIQINEVDLSTNATLPVGTNVLVHGFAAQGPTLELLNITSKSELEQVYGVPTTEAERYFYNTCSEILNSPANLLVDRLPYGTGAGAGTGDNYTGLFYPVSGSYDVATSGTTLSAWQTSSVTFTYSYDPDTFETFAFQITNISQNEYIIVSSLNIQVSSTGGSDTIFNLKPSYQIRPNVYQLTSDGINAPTYFDGEISMINGGVGIQLATPFVLGQFVKATATFEQNVLSATYSTGEEESTYEMAQNFKIGKPVMLSLSESEYIDIKSGQLDWVDICNATPAASGDEMGNCGFIIINKSKMSTDDIAQGYYVGIVDSFSANVSGNPQYDSIKSIYSVDNIKKTGFTTLASSILGHSLTGTDATDRNSISERIETGWQYDFTNNSYNDSVIISVFKLGTSNTAQDENKLYIKYNERYIGSFDEYDNQRTNPKTLQKESFFIGKTINEQSNLIEVYVNPFISKKATWVKPGEGRIGKVEVDTEAKAGFALGQFISTKGVNTSKIIGEIPAKLEKALILAENTESVEVDLVCEAGLGTIFAYAKKDNDASPSNFDSEMNVSTEILDLSDPETGLNTDMADYYQVVCNMFQNFVSETRKDCMFIADPLRGIFIQGEDFKTISRKDRSFSQSIYWPLKNLYSTANNNYVATYANWVKTYDTYSGKFMWMPFSGFQAAIMARMDSNSQPWFAPAGLERGIVRNIVDIAVNPTQKQRDMLYKIGINPVVFFPRDAYVVWGQKTLQAKPSAFDRINVRRLFLTLEKATVRLSKYFVMQPNTVFTRTRLVNYLKPIFDVAKQNEGVYDYLLVCDERNNTSDVIDNNELKLSIYLKPVRTAEFILIDFVATRTGTDFNEIIK